MRNSVILGVAAMAAIVVASNILVQFLVGDWLTWGAFVYPFAFLVTDVMNRVFGAADARRVVAAGFVVGIACSLAGAMIEIDGSALVTFRIALASGTAFLAAQLLDVAIFDRLRRQAWWRAPLVSSFAGSVVDTFLFFGIAFSAQLSFLEPGGGAEWAGEIVPLFGTGIAAPLWVGLAIADFCVKFSIALVALAPFKVVSGRLMRANSAVRQY